MMYYREANIFWKRIVSTQYIDGVKPLAGKRNDFSTGVEWLDRDAPDLYVFIGVFSPNYFFLQ